MKLVYDGVLIAIVFILASSLPAVIQAAVGKIFGGELSLDYAISIRPIRVKFHSSESMRDWQIRLVGASKLVFPVTLIIYSATLFSYQSEYRYVIFASLVIGATAISWTDLLAVENPRDWSLHRTGIYADHDKKFSIVSSYLPNIRERIATYLSVLILLAVSIIMVLEYEGVINLIVDSDNTPFEVATVSRIIGGVGSVLFSIILVILYDKQASISNTQSRIQEEQAELMRREREPRLSGPYNTKFWGSNVPKQSKLNSSTTTDPRSKERDPNPNSMEFFQTNAGEGLAQNFRLKILLEVEEGPHEKGGTVCAVQRMDRFPLRKFGESDLQGGEKDIEFMTEELKISFTEPDPDDPPSFDTYPFEEGINTLVKQGTTKITLIFTLVWEDEFKEKYTDQVYQKTSELSQGMDLLDFVK